MEEKQTLVRGFYADDSEYASCLEEWEWTIVNDEENYKGHTIPLFSKEEMYDYLAEFLRFLGRDVCILYNKMVTGNNIYVATDYDILGVSMNSIKIDNPCMIVSENEKYFNFLIVY